MASNRFMPNNMTKSRTKVLKTRAAGRKRMDQTTTPAPAPPVPAAAPQAAAAQAAAAQSPSLSVPPSQPVVDVEQFSRNIARMVEEGGKALAAYLKPREQGEVKIEPADEIADVVKTFGHVAEYWLSDPQRATEIQTTLGKAYLDLWVTAAKRLSGETVPPVIQPDPRDKRFADPEWSSNQFYDFLNQAYLLTAQWSDRLVKNAQGLDPHTRQKAEFYARQLSNAVSPSNFLLTNPELMRDTLSENA